MADLRKKLAKLLLRQIEAGQAIGIPYVLEAGNIDASNLPQVENRIPGEGGISTVRSMGINTDGTETLIPTVIEGKLPPSVEEAERQAIDYYLRKRRHFGKYASPAASSAAATLLHEREALRTGR